MSKEKDGLQGELWDMYSYSLIWDQKGKQTPISAPWKVRGLHPVHDVYI